ncbi:MAG: hypothetical protein JWN72_833 [Thermoleophilia bacterium]|nr:hypothetical protein [Thermoleophilia bacterium]
MPTFRKRTQSFELPDAQQLRQARDTVLEVVQTARGRAAIVAQQASERAQDASKTTSKRFAKARKDAPSVQELRADLRKSQAVEVGVAAASALVPVIANAWNDASKRKAVQRAIALAPVARTASKGVPALRIAGLVLTLGAAGVAARRWQKARVATKAIEAADQMNLDDDMARMDSEGPLPGTFEHAAANLLDSTSGGSVRPRRH